MEAVKILHIADIHIGRKFKNLSPRAATLRRSEVLMTFKRTLRRFDDAKIVLLAGDIFENDVSVSDIEFVVGVFNEHTDKKFFISCGNHDCIEYLVVKKFISLLPENVHVFSDAMEKVVVEEYNLEVYGASFCAPTLYSSLLSGFKADKTDRIQLMVLHADVNSDSPYNPVAYDEIEGTGLDYIALGHIHSFSGIQRRGQVHYAYPGVLEPGGFDETGECGVIYGDVYKGGLSLSFYPVSARQYQDLTVDITGCLSDADVIELLRKVVSKENLYRITFVGTSGFGSLDFDLYTDATDAFYMKFSDETDNKPGIFDYSNEDSLRGSTACELQKLKHTCDEETYKRACEILTKIMCRD